MNKTLVPFDLTNVTLSFARLAQPVSPVINGVQTNPHWSCRATGIPEEQAKDLMDSGVAVHQDDTGAYYMNIKEFTQNMSGETKEIEVFDSNLDDLTMEQRAMIGNGTKANIIGYLVPFSNENGEGLSARLEAVQVTEFVEYVPETRKERAKRIFG